LLLQTPYAAYDWASTRLSESHNEAIALLEKAEHDVAIDLQALLNLKSKVSYSHQSVSADDHNRANRAASHLVEAARRIAQPATGRGG